MGEAPVAAHVALVHLHLDAEVALLGMIPAQGRREPVGGAAVRIVTADDAIGGDLAEPADPGRREGPLGFSCGS
jgi:hypothetical protein